VRFCEIHYFVERESILVASVPAARLMYVGHIMEHRCPISLLKEATVKVFQSFRRGMRRKTILHLNTT